MNSTLREVSISGIVKPGDIYILLERDGKIDGPEYLYTIKTDEEIIAALDMDINIVCEELFEFRGFLGIGEISPDTHIIELLVFDKDADEEIKVPYMLYRVRSFQEELMRVKETFDRE